MPYFFLEIFMYPFITVFGKELSMYGIVSVAGLALATTVFYRLTRKYKYMLEDVIFITLISAAGIMVGGHLLYGITNIPGMIAYLQTNPNWGDFETWKTFFGVYWGGLVFYGGFIGSTLGVYWFTGTKYMKKHVDKKLCVNLYAVVIPLFHAFGRVGCFFAGCCYGIECDFGFVVTDNTMNPLINGPRRFPTPLLEAVGCLIIFAVLLTLWLKDKMRDKMLYLYCIMYPVLRFSDEFLRGDAIRGVWFGLSTSQWISIGLFIFGVVNLIIRRNNKAVVREVESNI